jgi:hypothetical protein
MKNLKDRLVSEMQMDIYPDSWKGMKNGDDLIANICDALEQCEFYNVVCESIEDSLDPHIFYDKDFQKKLAETLGNKISEYYDENFG